LSKYGVESLEKLFITLVRGEAKHESA